MRAPCTRDGCSRPNDSRGLCKKHYNREAARGTYRSSSTRLCSAPGCSRVHYARDFCRPHYKRPPQPHQPQPHQPRSTSRPNRPARPAPQPSRPCIVCGTLFRRVGTNLTCSPGCLAVARRERKQRRRALERGAPKAGRVFRRVVFDRDGWMCWLCRKPVDPALVVPAPYAATLDHVMPLALGGAHTYDNVRLAHMRCNSRRRATPPDCEWCRGTGTVAVNLDGGVVPGTCRECQGRGHSGWLQPATTPPLG